MTERDDVVGVRTAHRSVPAQRRITRPVIYETIDRPPAALIHRFLRCGVATIAEALGKGELDARVMHASMVRRTSTAAIAGPAVTVECADGDNLMTHAALRLVRPGDVLVISAGDSIGAQWGDLTTLAALRLGLAGVIIEGSVRDTDEIHRLGFPVWATRVSPIGAQKTGPGSVNGPISCSGVEVRPGEIVVADGDGVVVVPKADESAVLLGAEDRLESEAQARAAIRESRLPGDLTGVYSHLANLNPDMRDRWVTHAGH